MFGKVWRWAGHYRKTEKNLGVDPWRIGAGCAELFDTVRYWIETATYDSDELAVRLHHQLVSIHPFPNGNGRHSRLMADLLVTAIGGRPFTWGGGSLGQDGDLRRRYIAALQQADVHDIGPLLDFARS
jgi:Fic-DOC domain mobile mystery protein B